MCMWHSGTTLSYRFLCSCFLCCFWEPHSNSSFQHSIFVFSASFVCLCGAGQELYHWAPFQPHIKPLYLPNTGREVSELVLLRLLPVESSFSPHTLGALSFSNRKWLLFWTLPGRLLEWHWHRANEHGLKTTPGEWIFVTEFAPLLPSLRDLVAQGTLQDLITGQSRYFQNCSTFTLKVHPFFYSFLGPCLERESSPFSVHLDQGVNTAALSLYCHGRWLGQRLDTVCASCCSGPMAFHRIDSTLCSMASSNQGTARKETEDWALIHSCTEVLPWGSSFQCLLICKSWKLFLSPPVSHPPWDRALTARIETPFLE